MLAEREQIYIRACMYGAAEAMGMERQALRHPTTPEAKQARAIAAWYMRAKLPRQDADPIPWSEIAEALHCEMKEIMDHVTYLERTGLPLVVQAAFAIGKRLGIEFRPEEED